MSVAGFNVEDTEFELYAADMAATEFEEMKSYVGLTAEDIANIRAIGAHAAEIVPKVVRGFYEVLLRHPSARAVFVGGADQVARQRELLTAWLNDLFHGVYDEGYYASRLRIGETHARVGLPQRYMSMGMEIIRQEFVRSLQADGMSEIAPRANSLFKLLALDLTIMLQSYKDRYTEQIREYDRAAMETKMVRTQHLAEIGQLAASLAHEIKNPLAGISGAIQVIGESLAENDPRRPVVREILGQIGRLDATVRDLLLYARPSAPRLQETCLERLVLRVLNVLHEEPAMQRIRIQMASSERSQEAAVFADEGQLEQVVINLILNAAQASPEGAPIRIATEPGDHFITLVVQDMGIGMKEDVLARAMEPFFTTKAKGTGLGLAICRRIVDAHGGAITLHSRPGRGTTVRVQLPRAARTELERM